MTPDSTFAYGLSPGVLIEDRWEVVRATRHGGMSVAFEVKDATSGDLLELQHFPAGLFESETQLQNFADSFRAWCDVDTPSVVSVREVLTPPGAGMVLLTDAPAGTPLRERLDAGQRFSTAVAVGIARELLGGLVVVHGRGLVHGDLKPSTIFVDGDDPLGNTQMADGGITAGLWMAKDLGDKTALIGTPYYAPAEQFGGESPNESSDLYNVATVLFELVAGELPWGGRNFLEVFQAKIRKNDFSLRAAAEAEVSDKLEAAVAKGLRADPERRYRTASEFLAALEGAA